MPRKTSTKKSTSASVTAPATEEVEKKIGLFDVLDMIQTKRTPWAELDDGYKDAYSQFMINRFVSSVDFLVPIVEKMSTMKALTNEQHYFILTNSIPTGRKFWFNYKAYKKEKVEKDEEFLIWAISKEYEIGKREAKTYINNLSGTEIDQLKDKWEEFYKNK
jgi:hypothetical protein